MNELLPSGILAKSSIVSTVEELASRLEKSGFLVICAISHEVLAGHWIVVDKITETHVFIRDPDSGKAFKITKEEMGQNLKDDNQTFNQACVFLEKIVSEQQSAPQTD